MSWITCQPPRPSGIWTDAVIEPSAAAVAFPRGIDWNVQHVPVQLTRLPTTVDHSRSTGAPGVRPEAVTPTFDSTWPLEELSLADAAPAFESSAEASVVLASTVGETDNGQSIRARGGPASFGTVNVKRPPVAHGIGDCW